MPQDDNYGRRKYYSMDELKQLYPKLPSESLGQYQMRLGGIQWKNQTNSPPQPDMLDSKAPQAPFENNFMHGVRTRVTGPVADVFSAGKNKLESFGNTLTDVVRAPVRAAIAAPGAVKQMFEYASDNPTNAAGRVRAREAAATKPKPASVFSQQGQPLTSYKDPRWNDFEAAAEAKYGLPAGMLSTIRTKGERSNADQVSSAGARGVYQFIPSTRDAVLKKYGVDAYGSPAQAAMAAAALLKENMQRTGSAYGAIQQYHGGTDPRNYGPQNAAYMDRTMGAGGGGPGGFVNPFDASYYQQALGEADRAAQLASKPQSMTFTPETAPQAPDAADFIPPPTDFSKVDAAVQALKPVEITEAESLKMRRQEWFRGIGQALAAIPEGAGLGKTLAMLGGGSLQGAAAGHDRVLREMDKFEAKMAQYNVAVLNNESNQARVHHDEAAQKAEMLYKDGMNKWSVAYKEWEKYNNVDFDAQGNITSMKRDPKTGAVTMTRIPNAGAIAASLATRRAEIFTHMGDQQNAGNRLVATAQNGVVASTIAAQMAGGQADDSTVIAMPAMVASAIVDGGGLDQLILQAWDGDANMAQQGMQNLTTSARAAAMAKLGSTVQTQPGITGQDAMANIEKSPAYQEAYRAAIIQQIQQLALTRPKFREKLFALGGVYAAGERGMAMANRRTTTRSGPKGVTTSSTVDLGDQ